MKHIRNIAFIVTLFLSSCGGGGGGSDSSPTFPGDVALELSDNEIDTGDRVELTVYLVDVNDSGVILKIRMPAGLEYIQDSTSFLVDSIALSRTPTFNVSNDTANYLVYFLPRNIFGSANQGEIKLLLEGTAKVAAGVVEVDVDIDNPGETDSSQFSITNPNFSMIKSEEIVVLGEAVVATATPTA